MPAPATEPAPEDAGRERRDLSTLPKAHLHLHFTGSMRHGTLVELAERDVLREEVGHDAKGYPPPTVAAAQQHLASARRTLATVVPTITTDVLSRELTIPDLGTLSVEAWTPPILGHAAGHAQQALDVLADRGALGPPA